MSVILAMKTKEFAFTLPVVMVIYELMFFEGTLKRRLLYLVPFILTMLIIPLSLTGTSGSLSEIRGSVNSSGIGGKQHIPMGLSEYTVSGNRDLYQAVVFPNKPEP
jgi:hypothetical protein